MTAQDIKKELLEISSPEKKVILERFFKTGKGQYGEGDVFLGITVPQLRSIVKKYKQLENFEVAILLKDEYHECRMTALFFLLSKYEKTKSEAIRYELFQLYIQHVDYINNWDLVDLTAPTIVGAYFWDRNRNNLYQYAQSNHLWLQRISIIATFYHIRKNDFRTTLEIATILLQHKHDLIHKAVGWMLREIGKRDYQTEYNYLIENKRYQSMPRTMLRYAIEKFPESIRQDFLKGNI